MTTYNGYEFTWNPALPPLGDFYWSGLREGPSWDRAGNHPVDFDALVEAGYCRPVRITHKVEYL